MELQAELHAVRAALRSDTAYLGMTGETLQRYFLQLNEKENLLLSRQIRQAQPAGHNPSAAVVGRGSGVPLRVAAREPPGGAVRLFDRDDLASVLKHLYDYEASAAEAAKGLRALSGLAYKDAAGVGGHFEVLPQLLRLLALHSDDANVRLRAIQAISNMAYDSPLSMSKLSTPEVLGALLTVFAGRDPNDAATTGPAAEAPHKAGEAIARIVAAEFGSGPESTGPGKREPKSDGPLAALVLTASSGDVAWRESIPKILAQFVENEVVEVRMIAERFVVAGNNAAASPDLAAGWLSLSKLLASTEAAYANTIFGTLPAILVDIGVINVAGRLMERMPGEPVVQLTGLEAMSSLVGNRWSGLQAFADGGGIPLIQAAMEAHAGEVKLQTKGIRAMASGCLWPRDVQQKAQYDSGRGVVLTKNALKRHQDVEELCVAGLEALMKYITKASRKLEVADGDGAGLVEAVVGRHSENVQIQQLGKQVLGAISL